MVGEIFEKKKNELKALREQLQKKEIEDASSQIDIIKSRIGSLENFENSWKSSIKTVKKDKTALIKKENRKSKTKNKKKKKNTSKKNKIISKKRVFMPIKKMSKFEREEITVRKKLQELGEE